MTKNRTQSGHIRKFLLTNLPGLTIIEPAFTFVYGRLAQLVEHSLDVRRVSGSSPLTSTKSPKPLALGIFLSLFSSRCPEMKGSRAASAFLILLSGKFPETTGFFLSSPVFYAIISSAVKIKGDNGLCLYPRSPKAARRICRRRRSSFEFWVV